MKRLYYQATETQVYMEVWGNSKFSKFAKNLNSKQKIILPITLWKQNSKYIKNSKILESIKHFLQPNSNHPSVTTGCVFQVERMDLQMTTPMYPKELLNLIKQQKAGKTLLQHAHGKVFAKVMQVLIFFNSALHRLLSY